MQSGGQSAGIQLQVGLDLAFFRSQLQKVSNIASSEFTGRLDIRFNKSTLDAELNNLQKAIKRRVYRVEIGGNIDTLPDKVKKLRDGLAALESVKIDLGVGAVKSLSKKDASKINSELRAQVLGEQKKIYVPVSIKPSIIKKDVLDFKNAVQSKLSGITIKVKADLEAASISGGAKSRADINADVRRKLQEISEIGAQRMAGGGGGVTEAARRAQLKRALETGGFDIGGLKDIGKQLGIANAGRYKNANSLINKIVADASIEMVKKYLDPQAVMRNTDRSGIGKVLDTFARGIFNMLGIDPASIRAQQQASKPKPFAPAGLLPPAYRGIGPSAEPAGLLPPAYRGIGPSAKPAGLLPSLSSAGRGNAIIEALIASTGPRLLPSGGGDDSLGKLAAPRQTKDAVDAILRNYFKVVEAQIKEVFSAPPIKKESLNIFDHLNTEQYFNYLAQARINAENAIKQSIEEAKQVTKQNQIKDAAQSFLRALEETVRNAERSVFTQSRIAANRSYVQKANVREIGQPLLSGKQATPPKMLSAATGFYRGAATPSPLPETQAQLFARREREARMRSVLRGVDVMGETPTRAPARYSYANRPAMPRRPTSAIVPYEAGGAIVPSGGGGGGAPPLPPLPPRGGGVGGGAFGGMQFNMPQLPGAGLVREIGAEFGFAAKQVLLFGTTYKALAFLQSFPAQVGDAVGALQSFRNTLNAISPTAVDAAASNQLIIDTVDKYNIPIQSARDGFTKLYASMKPAGFSGEQIGNLFLGISKASATLGLSSDKVDRVTYAFSQMASKGQLMAEEVTGQLGDVIPGALSIMAEAANMDIKTFKKAMEDGMFVGKAFETVMSNVPIVMEKRFGKGAEGAAKTFQGALNDMQTSLTLLYEAFEPVAVGFLNTVVKPMTDGLQTITDGFNAFFTGQNAATPEAQNFNNVLKTLIPSLEGIAQNIGFALKQLLPLAQIVGAVIVQISRFLALPLVGYLAGTYLQVILLTSGFRLLATSGLMSAILATIQFIRQGILAASVMVGLRIATQQTTLATDMFGKTVQTVMIKTVIGIALVAIGALIAKIMELRGQLSAIGNDAKGMENLAKSSAKMGDVEGTKEAIGNIKDRLATFKELQKELQGAKKTSAGGSPFDDRGAISTSYQISSNTAKKLIELGVLNEKVLTKTSSGYSLLEDQMGTVNSLINKNVDEFTKAGQKGNILIDQATRKSKTQKTELENIDLSGGDSDAEAKKIEQERLRIAAEEQRRRIEAANHDNALMQINFQKDLQLTDAGFEHKKSMIDALHDYEMSGLNEMEARQKKFEKDLQDVQLQRVNAVRQALQKAVEAQVATQAAANVSRAAGGPAALSLPGPTGGGGAFDTGMRTGPSSAIGGSEPYHQDIMFGSTVSMKERVQLMDQLARGYEAMGRTIEFSNDAVANERYRSSMSYEAKSSLISRAQAAHANRPGGSGRPAMDYYAPLASSNRFGASVEGQAMLAPSVEGASYSYGGGGGGGRTMTASRNGKMVFEQLHGSMAVPLQSRAPSKNATVNTMARRETTEARDEEKALAQQSAALSIANLDIQNKIALAYQQTATIIKQNIDSIYPIEKIKLENKLSQIRHDLQMQNMPEEVIAYEERRAAAVAEGAMAEEVLKKNVADTKAEIKKTTAATAENEKQALAKSSALEVLNKNLELYKKGLADLPAKQKEMEIRLLEGTLAALKNADALKAQQEAMALIKSSVESASSSYKGFMKEVAMGVDPSEALKKFQEAITDQVLTVFFDFAMKPVEDFFKNQLSAMFGIETEESARKKAIETAERQLAELTRAKELQTSIDQNIAALVPGGTPAPDSTTPPTTSAAPSFTPGTTSSAASTSGFPIAAPGGIVASMTEAAMNGAALPFETGTADAANPVGAWGDSLNTQLSKSLTEATKTTDTEGKTLGESLGKAVGAVGMAAGAAMGIVAGISQIKEGGTSNVLGGIGSVLMSLGGAVGGFAGFLKGANGGVAGGGWKPFPVTAFANGGMVNGPTLGLVGEGKYNEAIVPLPDGRSIPVQMKGGSGLREAMSGNNGRTGGSPILNMSFQSTNINGVEYVSRDQLEQAMAATRRQAASDGAKRGMSMTLDKLQQSPSTRSRLGMGGR